MPVFVADAAEEIDAGETLTLFDAELLTQPVASISFTLGFCALCTCAITFSVSWADVPDGTVVEIQGSPNNADGSYVHMWSTGDQTDSVVTSNPCRYYRAALKSYGGGGALTVTAAVAD